MKTRNLIISFLLIFSFYSCKNRVDSNLDLASNIKEVEQQIAFAQSLIATGKYYYNLSSRSYSKMDYGAIADSIRVADSCAAVLAYYETNPIKYKQEIEKAKAYMKKKEKEGMPQKTILSREELEKGLDTLIKLNTDSLNNRSIEDRKMYMENYSNSLPSDRLSLKNMTKKMVELWEPISINDVDTLLDAETVKDYWVSGDNFRYFVQIALKDGKAHVLIP